MTEAIKDFSRTDGSDSGGVKDFSRKRKRLPFRVDDDDFEAASAIPAEILAEFAVKFEDATSTEGVREQLEKFMEVLELVLLEDSYTRLRERARDKQRPVELDQLVDIIEWLTEQYGLRPTPSSESSADGPPSPAPGTSSTDSTPAGASTSEPSPPTAS